MEGKERPAELGPRPYENLGRKTVGLLLRLTWPIHTTGCCVILDSGFCVLKGLVELRKVSVFVSALIKNKRQRKKYGHLPAKEAEYLPWERVNVDLIGPYTVRTKEDSIQELRALTMIDPATGWFETSPISDKSAVTVMTAFNNHWLCRYPQPRYIGFDNGSEFKAQFLETCTNYGVKTR